MTVGIVVAGTHYEYSDGDWEMLVRGGLETHAPILCHIIAHHWAEILQDVDERHYYNDLLQDAKKERDALRLENDELQKQQALGWESKPAKAKKVRDDKPGARNIEKGAAELEPA